jgi:hypothetical protein
VAEGTSLSIRQLDTIALKALADRRTVAKVLRGVKLTKDPHKQAAIIRVTKRIFPHFVVPTATPDGQTGGTSCAG